MKNLILVLVLAMAIVSLWVGKIECDKSGGVYIRGLFWMECIK